MESATSVSRVASEDSNSLPVDSNKKIYTWVERTNISSNPGGERVPPILLADRKDSQLGPGKVDAGSVSFAVPIRHLLPTLVRELGPDLVDQSLEVSSQCPTVAFPRLQAAARRLEVKYIEAVHIVP